MVCVVFQLHSIAPTLTFLHACRTELVYPHMPIMIKITCLKWVLILCIFFLLCSQLTFCFLIKTKPSIFLKLPISLFLLFFSNLLNEKDAIRKALSILSEKIYKTAYIHLLSCYGSFLHLYLSYHSHCFCRNNALSIIH